MTTKQILQQLAKCGKAVSLQHLYRYFRQFKISPVGLPQRPQQYPDDAAIRILLHLGMAGYQAATSAAPPESAATPAQRAAARLISRASLRASQKRSKPQTKGAK